MQEEFKIILRYQHNEFEVSLGYMRPDPKRKNERKIERMRGKRQGEEREGEEERKRRAGEGRTERRRRGQEDKEKD